jgi:hypothetical protein
VEGECAGGSAHAARCGGSQLVPKSAYTWDPEARVYRDANGNIVPEKRLQAWQAAILLAHKADMMAHSVALLDWKREHDIALIGAQPEIPPSVSKIVETFVPVDLQEEVLQKARRIGPLEPRNWQREMQRLISVSHAAMGVFGAGGFKQTTAGIWAKVQSVIARETAYEVRMAAQTGAGQVSPAELLTRTGMYAEQTYGTWQNTIIVRERGAGTEEARRFLEPDAEHCEDCFEAASDGWVPIEDVVPIGESQCGPRCRCHIDTRKAGGEEQSQSAAA